MSSVLGIGDLLFSDLLSELNIKPWWEKFRGYCFAASVTSALFMAYIILLSPTTITCTPLIGGNVSSKIDFSTTQAFFINNYCSEQIPWYVKYAGIISLVFTICILVASMWWLHIPGVISAFRIFAIFVEDIEKLELTSNQLGNYCSEIYPWSGPGAPEEAPIKLQKFRNTCNLLWKYKNSIDVNQFYFIRNVGLLCATSLSAVGSLRLSVFLFHLDNKFECSLDIDDECKIYGTTETMSQHFCSYNTSKRLVPFMIFSSISLIAQVIFILIIICKTYSNKLNVNLDTLSAKASKAYQYSVFMINFRENAGPCGSESFINFIEFMFSRALHDIFGQMEIVMTNRDNEMITIYSCVKYNGGNDIIKYIIERNGLTNPLDSRAANAIGHLGSLKWGKNTTKLIDYLFKAKYWKLLVHVLFLEVWTGLECSDKKKKFETYIKSLNLNTDEIGELDTHRSSILHYVIKDKLRYFQMAPEYKNPKYLKKCVHFDGKSEPISIVLEKLCIPKIPKAGRPTFPVKMFFKYTDCSENKSLEAITSLFVDHERDSQRLENQPIAYFEYQIKLAKNLSRFKFPEWNDDIKKLATFIHLKKQWVVLVELLNAFIVPTEANKSPVSSAIDFDCDGDRFILTDQDADGASILYYALDKPIYFRKGFEKYRNITFHYTAIRYILKFTDGQEQVVIYPTTDKPNKKTAKEYVEDFQNMDKMTKAELQRILNESTGRSPTPTPPQNPANQSNEGDNNAGPSGAKFSTQDVRPQASHNKNAYQEEENDLPDSRSSESVQIKKHSVVYMPKDCQEVDPHDPKSPESEQATNDCQENIKDDPQYPRSPESAYTMIDCQEVIEDNSQDFKSPELAHTTNKYPEDIGDGPQDSSSPESSHTTSNCPEGISEDPQTPLLGPN